MQMRVGSSRRSWAILLALTTVICGGLLPSSAVAGKGVTDVFGASGTGDGAFSGAGSLAVNLATGNVYVVDPAASRVEEFDAGGAFARAWGWGVATGASSFEECTSGCQVGNAGSGNGQFDGPTGVAIDQSDGSVYVVDANNSRVEKFDASGAYLSQFGSAGSGDGQLSGPQGIAVDPTDHSLYVADTSDNRVEHFDDTGAFLDTFGAGVSDGNDTFEVCNSGCEAGIAGSGDGALNTPTRVAVDSTGQVYVVDAGNGRIERFTSAGAFDSVFGAADVFLPLEIAVGPGDDHLYVAQSAQDFSEQHVVELDGSGALVDTHGVGSTTNSSSGLGLDAGSTHIYLADGGNNRVFVLGDLTAPTAAIDPATNVTTSSADLSGSVNPNGPPDVSWHFETSTDGVFWSPLAADQDAGTGTSDVPVTGSMSGLVPNTTYFVRLVATRPFNAPSSSMPIQFTTAALAPDVETLPANDLSPTHATFRGTIHAHNAATVYHFEYGPTSAYGNTYPTGSGVSTGALNRRIEVVQRIDTLEPAATYHYRIVAENQAGTVYGADQVFSTTTPLASPPPRSGVPGAGFLPDGRGWELVSPSEKHGNDVMADSTRARAAGDGDAVSFASLGGFGDVRGSGVATEYVSVRTSEPGTSGWTTHAITPRQDPLTVQAVSQNRDPEYVGDFSEDLSTGVFQSWSPVTDDANVAKVSNLYLRRDLRSSGEGSYELLSGCPACGNTPLPGGTAARLAGASSDFSHFVFESNSALTSDTPHCPFPPAFAAICPLHLYEYDHGTVRLAGILPDGTAAPRSVAGQGMASNNHYTPHTISADGSRIFFTDNSATNDGFAGDLYMRANHVTTVQLNASERVPPEPTPQPATYWTSSSDGSRAFFTTQEQLTDEDTNSAIDLYMYSAVAINGKHLTRLSIDHEPSDGDNSVDGVLGTSDDGHYVYFMAGGQLLAGGPNPGNPAIYLWHDGHLAYIGESTNGGLEKGFNTPGNWVLRPLASRVTPDGRFLLFTSWSGTGRLTGYDHANDCLLTSLASGTEPCHELYLYDAASDRLACVSCHPAGRAARSSAEIFVRERTSAATTTWHLPSALSRDGRRVFFTSGDSLVPADSNGRTDVYEYDVPTGTVHLLSSGKDPSDSYLMDASPNGSDVFFLTRERLVGWDVDQSYDLYDARIGGGLPEPISAAPDCSGDGCKGAAAAPLTGGVSASSVFHGGGNKKTSKQKTSKRSHATKRVKCRRGYVLKHVKRKGRERTRCVKKPRKSHQAGKRGVR
jgi:DNA-binding beta-propeller fold protein YncE